jgi:hypothetical protein
MPPETRKLDAGDGTLTRRILKRCRKEGRQYTTDGSVVRIGRGRFGYRIDAYLVPADIYEEECARRRSEIQAKNKHLEEEILRDQEERRQKRFAALKAKFPQLSDERLQQCDESMTPLYADADVGYQFGLGTKSYWKQLGYRVSGKPTGKLVRGRRLLDIYHYHSLSELPTRVGVHQLHARWMERYGSEDVVLAEAIRFANRLQKVKRHPDFYSLKDDWIARNQGRLNEGRVARHEKNLCWDCGGSGDRWGNVCWKCDGTGLFSSRKLYEHIFEIAGRQYVFHSYKKPSKLSSTPGANLKAYGHPFTPDELPVPRQSLLVALIKHLLSQDKHDEKSSPPSCRAVVERRAAVAYWMFDGYITPKAS